MAASADSCCIVRVGVSVESAAGGVASAASTCAGPMPSGSGAAWPVHQRAAMPISAAPAARSSAASRPTLAVRLRVAARVADATARSRTVSIAGAGARAQWYCSVV